MPKLNVFALLVCLWKISSSQVIVKTNSGPIRSTASLSDDVDAFLGVPYAEPPIGDLRFAKPVKKKQWTEIYDASSLPPPCMQLPLNFSLYFMLDIKQFNRMSEDCLYLNIWTPKVKTEEYLKPVIVYIHQGSFCYGSSIQKTLDGSHLASKGDVVVVTINYRLGSLGFLLAYIEEADGNMGMYDQLMALEWIKDNAKHFGGDPENIILMGTSTGAWSVGIHMVSPLSQNLFKRAIFQSGSIIHPLLENGNNKLFRNSAHVADVVGCTNESVSLKSDPRTVVECLKGKPKEMLVEADLTLMHTNALMFFPRVGDQLLPNEATLLYRKGKFRKDTDVMIGTANNEGGLLLVGALLDFIGLDGKIPMNMSKSRAILVARLLANLGGIQNPTDFVNFYITKIEDTTPEDYMKALSYAVGDFAIACGSVFLADFLSLKGNRVHYYKFGFRAASTPMAEWIEVTHLDDVQYVFGNPYHKNFTAKEQELSNRLIARISSFSRTGNPNAPGQIPWLRYSYHNPLYLFIGQEEDSIRLEPYDRCIFWRKEFKSDIDPDLIRSLRNSGMNITNESESST